MTTPETTARGEWYGFGGFADVRIDGVYGVGGHALCGEFLEAFRSRIEQRLAETGGESPVRVSGWFSDAGTEGTLQATFELLDPAALGSIQATLYLYEDNVTWCCDPLGHDKWDEVARVVRTRPVTLTDPGDRETVVEPVTLEPSWNRLNLHAVALLQEADGNRAVIQAARLTNTIDFTMDFPRTQGSVPGGNGSITFEGTIRAAGALSDLLTLSVDEESGWPMDFRIEGDPSWYTETSIPLASGEARTVTVRLRTDGVTRIGTGEFLATSANTGRAQPARLRVFNGSPSLLLVDDDHGFLYGGTAPETTYETGLAARGYLYDDWNVSRGHDDHTPALSEIAPYDIVIWETGCSQNPLTAGSIATLEGFLDAGGRLYLDSMQLLDSQGGPNPFVTDYLGVSSWHTSSHAQTAYGAPGDPITDGMVLPVTFPGEGMDGIDWLYPTPSSAAILDSETGRPAAARHWTAAGGGVVFTTIPQMALSTDDPDPDNSATLLDRAIRWLMTTGPAAVEELHTGSGSAAIRLWGGFPNPLHDRTELRFWLSPAAARQPLELIVADASGRLVRTLAGGRFAAGEHRAVWDAVDAAGRPVASGGYFVRLHSGSQGRTARLTVVR